MSRFSRIGHRLYTGEVSYDFIGHRRRWYIVSAILIGVSLIALFGRGISWGIEFKGGADFQSQHHGHRDHRAGHADRARGVRGPRPRRGDRHHHRQHQVRVQTRTLDPTTEVPKVREAIAKEVGVDSDQVAYSLIGASWGGQITERALIALGVFLLLVTLVIWAYFRNWKMSIAALIALLHDLVLTIGIYALVGFTVTPATVIGVLTILGYSLYDTVVVFDKVRENVRDLSSSATKTYSEAANLAVNQVLVRSINTTIIGVLPVAALLFAGAFILGEGPLKDLALALFVGMVSGAYSSIFIATPLLAQLKEREPEMQKLAKRVAARRAKEAARDGGRSTRPGATDDDDDDALPEPSDAELADTRSADDELADADRPTAGEPARTRVTVSSSAPIGPLRTLGDGGAKRPQPQHKPRSQRKK